jgi:hypothetical protein
MPKTVATTKRELAPAPNSLVASAARIRGGTGFSRPKKTESSAWHMEAWTHYRNIGEFRYSCDWVGAMLSKAEIFATVETTEGVEKIEEGNILEYISAFFGNADGRAEMFRLVGIHMSVTGECYIVGYPDPDPMGDGGDKWEVAASTKCVRPTTDNPSDWWRVNDVTLTGVPQDEVTAIRVWRPDPLDPQLSISPALAAMTTLRQLHKLSLYISAQLDSRLASAGILLMPDTMVLPPAPTADGKEPLAKSANNAEELMTILMESMTAQLMNPGTAESQVPIVVTASVEAIAAVQHLTFWSELDEHAMELRKEAIGRLALSMDVPPEVLQGASDSNHWSAWQADESAIKAHAEPLLKIITTAIGKEYLRPLLSVDSAYDGDRLSAYSVAADTSEMRLRPNRSKEALELYNLGELSGAALLRETGFEISDAMQPEELALWLTRKVALGSTTPELVEAALRELGVKLTVVRPEAADALTEDVSRETGTEGRPAPSLKDHPVNDIPDPKRSADRKEAREEGRVPSSDIERKASLLAASEQLVFRALERAGNKLKQKMGGLKVNCSAAELYMFASGDAAFLLDDAWGGVPLIAKRAGLDTEALAADLQEYTEGLLVSQQPHTYEALEAFMTRELVAA